MTDALTIKHARLTVPRLNDQQKQEAQAHLARVALTGYHQSANSTTLPEVEETTIDEEPNQDGKQLIQRQNPQAHRRLKPKK